MHIQKKLTLADFQEMFCLEAKYYTVEHITPAEEAYNWYLHFPDYSTVLKEDDQIIGFLDMFPIKQELFDTIKTGTFNDANMTLDLIENIAQLKPGDKTNMFLCCIVIDKDYRKTDAMKLLFQNQIDYFQSFIEKGIEIEYIITDNVTSQGAGLSKRFCFEMVTPTEFDSVIYMKKYHEFTTIFNEQTERPK